MRNTRRSSQSGPSADDRARRGARQLGGAVGRPGSVEPSADAPADASHSQPPVKLEDLLPAQPAMAQVAALEAAVEAVLGKLEAAASASQPQVNAAATARQEVAALMGEQT